MAVLSNIITPGNVLTATNTQTVTNKTISGANNTISNINLATQVTGNLPVTNLNSGTSATSSTFWRGDGTWAAPTGTGDVVGPSSATDNAIARYDGTTGKLIQNSAVTIADTTGSMTFSGSSTRISAPLGSFSSSDLIFQNSSTGYTLITAMPNASTGAGVGGWGASDLSNSTAFQLYADGSTVTLFTTKTGSATNPSLKFSVGGSTRQTITTNGGFAFGTSATAYGTSGQVLTSNGDAPPSWTTLSASGDVVGPASATDNAIPRFDGTTGKLIQNSGITITDGGNLILAAALDEKVFAVTGTTPALSPTNGTIQTWTLSGNSTPTQGTWVEGESMTLMILDGTAFTVTWTSLPVTWVGGTAPVLDTTRYTIIELWEVGTTIYGALVGYA